MDIVNVCIVYDTYKYTKEDVVEDLKKEGYKHNFYFFRDILEDDVKQMRVADEVWQFGECIGNPLLKRAREMGKEIWRMS